MTVPDHKLYEDIYEVIREEDVLPEDEIFEVVLADYLELAKYADQLPICRVFNFFDVEPEGRIDLMIVNETAPDSMPKNVKAVAYIDCSFTEVPKLPSSVVYVDYSTCMDLETISGLPKSLGTLSVFEWRSDRGLLPVSLPAGLVSLKMKTTRPLHFKGKWPARLKSFQVNDSTGITADLPMPKSLRSFHYVATPNPKILSLSKTPQLKSIKLSDAIISFDGHAICTGPEAECSV